MNDMGKWRELFDDAGGDPDAMQMVPIPHHIPVGTCIWEDGMHGIVIGNVDVIRVHRDQVGLALEVVYATIGRLRSYLQTEAPPTDISNAG